MAKIRISKKDRLEYQRLKKNTLAKIRRTKKNYDVDLSSEVNLPSLDDFTSRKEFNKWKAEQSRFTNRSTMDYQFVKNKHDVVVSKTELSQAIRYTRQAQEKAKKLQNQLKDKPFMQDGKVVGTVGQQAQMVARPNIAGVYVPSDFNFDEIKDKGYFDQKKDAMQRRSRPDMFEKQNQQMKENFIDLVRETFNSYGDVLIEKIQKLDSLDFLEMYAMNSEFDFDLFYTLPPDEMEQFVSTLLDIVENHTKGIKDGTVNTDLKNANFN